MSEDTARIEESEDARRRRSERGRCVCAREKAGESQLLCSAVLVGSGPAQSQARDQLSPVLEPAACVRVRVVVGTGKDRRGSCATKTRRREVPAGAAARRCKRACTGVGSRRTGLDWTGPV
jgi:hypothetical protein